ncbi:MAG: hypothetical protein V1751_08345 [Pseudomonadota bacterium]
MKLIKLSKIFDTKEAFEVLDDLRDKLQVGEIIGFCAVAIGKEDSTYLYTGTTQTVTQLKMKGAIMQMLLHHDEALDGELKK